MYAIIQAQSGFLAFFSNLYQRHYSSKNLTKYEKIHSFSDSKLLVSQNAGCIFYRFENGCSTLFQLIKSEQNHFVVELNAQLIFPLFCVAVLWCAIFCLPTAYSRTSSLDSMVVLCFARGDESIYRKQSRIFAYSPQ